MKVNKNLLSFFKSTVTVVALSSLSGWAFMLLNKPFLPAFLLTIGVQYILFTAVAGTVNNYFIQQTKQKELDKLENLSTLLECAACKAPNITTFIPDQNERFEFVCDKCEGKNVVNINFTVARVTELSDPMSVAPNLPNITTR